MPIIQLTGLSGAGKTTLATKVVEQLKAKGIEAILIDGDVYRKTICKDLGFSKEDRLENIKRLGLVADEFSSLGKTVIIAAINPYEAARQELSKNMVLKPFGFIANCQFYNKEIQRVCIKKRLYLMGIPIKLNFLRV
jgi:adenylylsulfate kinase